MADVNIKATLSVESGNSAKSINDLKSELLTTKKNLDSAKIGSDEFKKAQVDLAKQQKELVNAYDQTGQRGRRTRKGYGRLIFAAWKKDGGKTNAAVMKAIERSRDKFYETVGY